LALIVLTEEVSDLEAMHREIAKVPKPGDGEARREGERGGLGTKIDLGINTSS